MAEHGFKQRKYENPISNTLMEIGLGDSGVIQFDIKMTVFGHSYFAEGAKELKHWRSKAYKAIRDTVMESNFRHDSYISIVEVAEVPVSMKSNVKIDIALQRKGLSYKELFDEGEDFLNVMFLRLIDSLPEDWVFLKKKSKKDLVY